MSLFNKETQKSVRVVLPKKLYDDVKDRCLDYGDLSRVVRHLLKKWLKEGGTIRQVYDNEAKDGELEPQDNGRWSKPIIDTHPFRPQSDSMLYICQVCKEPQKFHKL